LLRASRNHAREQQSEHSPVFHVCLGHRLPWATYAGFTKVYPIGRRIAPGWRRIRLSGFQHCPESHF